MKIRKIAVTLEETHLEIGKEISPPTRRAAAIAVIENPFSGKYKDCLLYTSPSPRDVEESRMPSSA